MQRERVMSVVNRAEFRAPTPQLEFSELVTQRMMRTVGSCFVIRLVFVKLLVGHYIVPVVVCWLGNSTVETQQAVSSFKVNQSAMSHLVSLVTVSGPSETLSHSVMVG